MKVKLLVAACVATLAMPFAAQAQNIPGGAAHGFNEGAHIAGPLGAVVGGAVGGVVGGFEGAFGINHQYAAQPQPVAYRHRYYRHHWHHWHHRHHRHYRYHH